MAMDRPRRDLLAVLLPVTRELRRIEDAAAAAHGLTMWQYAILSAVVHRAGLNQGEVADLLGYSKNRIVADLDELERQGLLRRTRGADRRANVLSATAAGARRMRAVQRDIHDGEDAMLAQLSTGQRAALAEAADRLAGR